KPNIDRLNNEKILCGLDLFGSMFFMLSRYEEMVVKERDQHDRFSAKSSVAFKGEFLMRPIVNEYLEILWQLLSYLDNSLIRRERTFKTILTCDVDWPFNPINRSYNLFAKTLLSSVAKLSLKKSFNIVKEF